MVVKISKFSISENGNARGVVGRVILCSQVFALINPIDMLLDLTLFGSTTHTRQERFLNNDSLSN